MIDDDYERMPGLFPAWDFGMVLEVGYSYRIENGGHTEDGQPLYVVFRSVQPAGASWQRCLP
ncbi:hypothetical protein [Loktanella fryxellensis]|nr:hypothetical protein [Loktanella fryxellensis]